MAASVQVEPGCLCASRRAMAGCALSGAAKSLQFFMSSLVLSSQTASATLRVQTRARRADVRTNGADTFHAHARADRQKPNKANSSNHTPP
eukprot:7348210-Prymnesium_polylepis.1